MKILHINSYFSTSKFYKNLYDKQIDNGLNICTYIPISFIEFNEDGYGEYTIISKSYNKRDRYIFHLKHLKILKDIQKKIQVSNYSIIHAHSLFSNGYIAYKLNKKYNIPYIVAVRNTDVNVFFKRVIHLRRLGVNILRNASKIVFISEPYKDYTLEEYIPAKYREEINNKSVVITNGIDEFWYRNIYKEKRNIGVNKVKLIYVGTIDKNKNIETTIEACKILIGEGYEVEYKVVGKVINTEYGTILEKYNFIKHIAYSPREELINYYRESDIFIMPSKHETFGLVYAEAMSQGLPVIYTRGQGFDGQFEEGEVGYSVKYDDAEEITIRIKDIINNYEEVSNNCNHLSKKFDWTIIANRYNEMYELLN